MGRPEGGVARDHRAPRWLVTGFEPFGGEAVNPSWQVAQALHGQVVAGGLVHALELPCVFGRSIEVLDEACRALQPQVVLALGQAGGRAEITVERVAINVDDARIADNAGGQPIDEAIVAGAPAAYFSTLPLKAIVQALRQAGLPAAVSQTAGTFVCNHVFYGLMHGLRRRRGVRAGFVHLPWLPAQAVRFPGQPSMALEQQVAGVRLALQTAAAVDQDLRLSGGSIA